MNKAVLVLENMPESCCDCPICDADEDCLAMEQLVSVTEFLDAMEGRPDWCPLVPMPERRKPLNKKGYRSGYIEGWNDAIDAIEREV